jgi:hypothetical protein
VVSFLKIYSSSLSQAQVSALFASTTHGAPLTTSPTSSPSASPSS